MTFLMRRGAAAVALLSAFAAAPAGAQSLLSSRGLGYPIEPLDARARGLGGLATGLAEPVPSMINPAAAAGITAFGFIAAIQPERYDATANGGVQNTANTVRFPLLVAVLPVTPRLVAQAGYGTFLDQHWQVEQSDSITLSTGRVGVTDRFSSSGGVARFQGGLAYRVNERLSGGAAADVFTGAARDSSVRLITGVAGAITEVVYTYSGVGARVGARWQALDRLTIAAAAHGGGHIRAVSDSTGTERKDYTNPTGIDGGASYQLGRSTLLAASASWNRWGALNDELSAVSGGSRDALTVAGGVEYTGLQFARKALPLRLGGRYAELPFRWSGASSAFPTERAVSLGAGYSLGGRAALLDAAAERGWRGGSAAGIDESYWRFSFSVRVLAR